MFKTLMMVSATKARQNKTNPNQTKPKNNSALIDNVWKAQSVSGLETVFSPTGVQSGADQFRMSGTMATKSVEFVPFFLTAQRWVVFFAFGAKSGTFPNSFFFFALTRPTPGPAPESFSEGCQQQEMRKELSGGDGW